MRTMTISDFTTRAAILDSWGKSIWLNCVRANIGGPRISDMGLRTKLLQKRAQDVLTQGKARHLTAQVGEWLPPLGVVYF